MADEAFLEATYQARDKFVTSLGVPNQDVLAPLINPTFLGGPSWPDLRQAWRVIRRGANTIIMSDGLSDPFSDMTEPNVGFGLEILAETSDSMPDELHHLRANWLFDLTYQVSQRCASHGAVRELIEEFGVISLEASMSEVPEFFSTPSNYAGVLLGMTSPDLKCEFELPSGP
jgi:hypothetical protein